MVNDFPVPSRDVTYQTLRVRIIPGQGEFGKWHPGSRDPAGDGKISNL